MTDGCALHRSAPCYTNNSCNDIEEDGEDLAAEIWGSGVFCLSFPVSLHWIFATWAKRLLFDHLCSSLLSTPTKQRVVMLQVRELVIIKSLWKDTAGCWSTPEGIWPFISDFLIFDPVLGVKMPVWWFLLPTSATKMLPPEVYRGGLKNWAGKSSSFIHTRVIYLCGLHAATSSAFCIISDCLLALLSYTRSFSVQLFKTGLSLILLMWWLPFFYSDCWVNTCSKWLLGGICVNISGLK